MFIRGRFEGVEGTLPRKSTVAVKSWKKGKVYDFWVPVENSVCFVCDGI